MPQGSPHSCSDANCEICRLFGAGNVRDHIPDRGPTRLLFRDAPFSEESRKVYEEAMSRGDRYFETKTETQINRDTGAAFGGSLRTFERIPPGAKFDLLITLRALAGDNVPALKAKVERGLKALENDYLGGSGSRGYGKVRLLDWKWEQVSL
ncbi:MAG: type III-A CRISPR-associated RAMP protein Csm3 [Chloroflexota bacterium]|nr:type III-A CRISPR-associated RAMP protein Csm3 [Chloroflexota bacterium]